MPLPEGRRSTGDVQSARGLLEARRDIAGQSKAGKSFTERIAAARQEQRGARRRRQKREWPRRKAHTSPQPPILLRLTKSQKAKIHNELCAGLTHANGNGIGCHWLCQR